MENPEKIKTERKRPYIELEKYASYAKDRLIILLRGLSQPDMIAKIKELNLTDKSLDFLCNGIALETEDYEICGAVQKIKASRASPLPIAVGTPK